jgi:lipoate-protein ligase B
VEVCETPRGGQVTLHAPGQLVAYPVLRIGTRVRAHVQRIGEVAASQVRAWGVAEAQFRMEHPGVWIGARKLASIGVHVSRGVTVQGIAINLAVDPALFSALVSCGLPEGPMANMADFVADVPDVEAAGRDYAVALAGDLQRPLRWIDRAQIVDPPPV